VRWEGDAYLSNTSDHTEYRMSFILITFISDQFVTAMSNQGTEHSIHESRNMENKCLVKKSAENNSSCLKSDVKIST